MQEFLKTIITEAGAIAKNYFFQGVTHTFKSNSADLLTIADTTVEQFLVDKISARYPTHHIHTEERAIDINPGAEYEWVIDPIDGTRNFAMGISFWCHLIAVLKNGQPYLAAVYNPIAEELFFAEKGKGAFLNGRPIHVNTKASMDYAFACLLRSNAPDPAVRNFNPAITRVLNETTAWVHNFGTMLSVCHLALGGIDVFIHNSGMDHDYQAPTLIASEAGALVTDSEGNPWKRGRRDVVIANPVLHAKMLEFFK